MVFLYFTGWDILKLYILEIHFICHNGCTCYIIVLLLLNVILIMYIIFTFCLFLCCNTCALVLLKCNLLLDACVYCLIVAFI